MPIYRVEPRTRVVEASNPRDAAFRAGFMPSECIVTEITNEVIALQTEGDLAVLKGKEIKG